MTSSLSASMPVPFVAVVPILVSVVPGELASSTVAMAGDVSFAFDINRRDMLAGRNGSQDCQDADDGMLVEHDSDQTQEKGAPDDSNDHADDAGHEIMENVTERFQVLPSRSSDEPETNDRKHPEQEP